MDFGPLAKLLQRRPSGCHNEIEHVGNLHVLLVFLPHSKANYSALSGRARQFTKCFGLRMKKGDSPDTGHAVINA